MYKRISLEQASPVSIKARQAVRLANAVQVLVKRNLPILNFFGPLPNSTLLQLCQTINHVCQEIGANPTTANAIDSQTKLDKFLALWENRKALSQVTDFLKQFYSTLIPVLIGQVPTIDWENQLTTDLLEATFQFCNATNIDQAIDTGASALNPTRSNRLHEQIPADLNPARCAQMILDTRTEDVDTSNLCYDLNVTRLVRSALLDYLNDPKYDPTVHLLRELDRIGQLTTPITTDEGSEVVTRTQFLSLGPADFFNLNAEQVNGLASDVYILWSVAILANFLVKECGFKAIRGNLGKFKVVISVIAEFANNNVNDAFSELRPRWREITRHALAKTAANNSIGSAFVLIREMLTGVSLLESIRIPVETETDDDEPTFEPLISPHDARLLRSLIFGTAGVSVSALALAMTNEYFRGFLIGFLVFELCLGTGDFIRRIAKYGIPSGAIDRFDAQTPPQGYTFWRNHPSIAISVAMVLFGIGVGHANSAISIVQFLGVFGIIGPSVLHLVGYNADLFFEYLKSNQLVISRNLLQHLLYLTIQFFPAITYFSIGALTDQWIEQLAFLSVMNVMNRLLPPLAIDPSTFSQESDEEDDAEDLPFWNTLKMLLSLVTNGATRLTVLFLFFWCTETNNEYYRESQISLTRFCNSKRLDNMTQFQIPDEVRFTCKVELDPLWPLIANATFILHMTGFTQIVTKAALPWVRIFAFLMPLLQFFPQLADPIITWYLGPTEILPCAGDRIGPLLLN